MSLPDFNKTGDLPEGIHRAPLAEVMSRFGSGSPQREAVTARLKKIVDLATATGGVERMIVFGSYITDKVAPNDVDLILVMRDDFRVEAVSQAAKALFDHGRSATELGASVFWLRPSMLLRETLNEFLAYWQVKRDQTKRGIVEITL